MPKRLAGVVFLLCWSHLPPPAMVVLGIKSTSPLTSLRWGLLILSRHSIFLVLISFLLLFVAVASGGLRWNERLIVLVQHFLQLIGWTPLVELKRITSKAGIDARIVGKIEAYQPLCSIKDRSALRHHLFLSASFFSFNWSEIYIFVYTNTDRDFFSTGRMAKTFALPLYHY